MTDTLQWGRLKYRKKTSCTIHTYTLIPACTVGQAPLIGSQTLPGYIGACVLTGDMRKKAKCADTGSLMDMYGAREICMYRT